MYSYSRIFKILISIEIILLFIQFWLGMSTNLFVFLPLNSAVDFGSYSGGTQVFAHIINGVLIFALAGLILSYGFRLKSRIISALSILALISAFVAVSTGATFAFSLRDDSLSMAMAMSFLTGFSVYFCEFYFIGKMDTSASYASKTIEKEVERNTES